MMIIIWLPNRYRNGQTGVPIVDENIVASWIIMLRKISRVRRKGYISAISRN